MISIVIWERLGVSSYNQIVILGLLCS